MWQNEQKKIRKGIKDLVILQRGHYSQDFVDKTLLNCCFVRYCFSGIVDMSFTIILITAEQSFKLSSFVHIEVGNKKSMHIKLPPTNGKQVVNNHKEMLYPMDH